MRPAATLIAVAAALLLVSCGDSPAEKTFGFPPDPAKSADGVKLDDVTRPGKPSPGTPIPPKNGVALVFFGFASCPDVCPTTLADIGTAIRTLPVSDRKRVTTIFITVDPKRDSGAMLRMHLGHFFVDSPWRALRSDDAEALAKAEKAFGASHKIGRKKRDGEYDVSHTTYTYAVDDSGEILLEWPFGISTENLAHDLRLLLKD